MQAGFFLAPVPCLGYVTLHGPSSVTLLWSSLSPGSHWALWCQSLCSTEDVVKLLNRRHSFHDHLPSSKAIACLGMGTDWLFLVPVLHMRTLLREEGLTVLQMEIAVPEAAMSRAGRGRWTSAWEEPVGKQQGLGRCQCWGTALRQSIQKSC